MAKPLSDDIHIRIITAVDDGMSCRAAAERFSVVASTLINMVRRHRETGEILAKRHCHTNWSDKQGSCAIDIG